MDDFLSVFRFRMKIEHAMQAMNNWAFPATETLMEVRIDFELSTIDRSCFDLSERTEVYNSMTESIQI
jgi:hypothetical protein